MTRSTPRTASALMLILAALALAGCASDDKPVGIGSGRSEFKESPCKDKASFIGQGGVVYFQPVGCFLVPQQPVDDAWKAKMKAWADGAA